MRRGRLALLVLAVPGAFALGAPSGAGAAAPSVIGFDDLPANTAVTTQYQATQNIEFGRPGRWLQGYPALSTSCDSDGAAAPVVVDGGIAGRSGSIVCSGDEIQTLYTTAMHTDIERSQVSFRLRGTKIDGDATVEFWNAGTVGGPPSLIESRAVPVPDNAVINVARDQGLTQNMVTVVVKAVGKPFSTLVIDDISMRKEDVPPLPKFSFSLARPTVDLIEGSSVDAPIEVQRYNGSTGAVTFTPGALPPGVSAAQVVPNPVVGTNPPAFRIAADSPFSGATRQVSLTASGAGGAGTFIGGGRVQTVTPQPAILAGDGGVVRPGAQTSIVSGCGGRGAEYPVTVRGGFTGPVDLLVSKLDGPVTVADSFVRLNAAGNGTLTFPYGLTQALGVRGGSTLKLEFRPLNATAVTATVRVFEDSFSIDSIGGIYSPYALEPPEFLPGAGFGLARSGEVVLKGNFPGGCSPNFLDDAGRSIDEISRREDPAGGLDTYRLKLPSPPTTTAVRAMGPGSVELARSKVFEVIGYRNGDALRARNSSPNAGTSDFTWGDFLHAFGSDDGDACSPFECHRDPFALLSFDNIRDKLRNQKGLCFGYVTQSILFKDDLDESRVYFTPPLRPWLLPFYEGSKIKKEVIRWQITQHDGDWADYVSDLKDDVPTFAEFRSRLRTALENRDETLLAIRSGSSGHAVVAYDLREEPNGTLDILTYNPNTPYVDGEATSNATRIQNAAQSTIFVRPNGTWSGGIFTGGGTSGPWTGGMSTIEIYDRMPPLGADLPFGFFAQTLDAAADTARVTSIKAGGTEGLRSDGSSIGGTGVNDIVQPSGPGGPVDYRLARGRSYDVTVTGTGSGTFGDGLIGGKAAAKVDGLRTRRGQEDHITLTPGVAGLGVEPGGADSRATIRLLARAGRKATQGADVSLTTGDGAKEQATLAGGAVDLRHAGPPTNVSVKLVSTGLGAPAAVSTAPIRLGRGQRLTLRPGSWSDLGAGVGLTVRNAKGRIVRRGRARLKATNAVRLGRVSARLVRKGTELSLVVTGRVTKAGRSPLLIASVSARSGRRVISLGGASRRGARRVQRGAFTLSVALKTRPRGARLRVAVSLVDEAADFASARRALSVR